MRKLFLLFLSGTLSTACVDKDYDLENVDTGNVSIGGDESEFRIPLAKVLVSDKDTDLEAIFREADIWLPSPLPENKTSVDLQLLQTSQSEVDKLLDALTTQMLSDDPKINAVAELLCDPEKDYLDTFLPLLPPGTSAETFIPAFIAAFRYDAALRDQLGEAVKAQARSYLTTLSIEPLIYDVGHIGIDSDVVDMLADNLDPEGTPNAKNTLHLYGEITSGLPLTLRLDPLLSPTEVTFRVEVDANSTTNEIPETQLFADDLRKIVEGITIHIPVTLETYYPGKGFREGPGQQLVIDLRLLKKGGLKLDI